MNSSKLIIHRYFFPFILTQFLEVSNDTFFRTALISWFSFGLPGYSSLFKSMAVTLSLGLFMLPYFLFSPYAGQLADKYSKVTLIRLIKFTEVIIAILAFYGFLHSDPFLLLLALFLMGTHAAFFGPLKFSIIPEIVGQEELLMANAYIESSTFLGIIISMVGGTFILFHTDANTVGLVILILAVLGFLSSLWIPRLPPSAPLMEIQWGFRKQLNRMLAYTQQNRQILEALLILAWLWMMGSLCVTQLPSLVKTILGDHPWVLAWEFFVFGIGVGIGAFASQAFFRAILAIRYIPWLVLLAVPFLLNISWLNPACSPNVMPNIFSFFIQPTILIISLDFFCIAFLGSFAMVPLFTFVQAITSSSYRAQVIAVGNMLIAGFIVIASILSSIFLFVGGLSIAHLFFIFAIGQIIFTIILFFKYKII